MHLTCSRRGLVTALAAVAFLACAEGPFDPEVVDVVGMYEAEAFYLVQGSDSADFLDDGVQITLSLAEDFTTSGRFYAPALNGAPEADHSLAGTWAFVGRTIELDHPAQTVLRDTPLRVPRAGQLEIREALANARYVMVLRRRP